MGIQWTSEALTRNETESMISRLRNYTMILESNIPNLRPTLEARAIITAYNNRQVRYLNSTIGTTALLLNSTGVELQKGTYVLVAYDLLAISMGHESPSAIGHYFREAETFRLSFE